MTRPGFVALALAASGLALAGCGDDDTSTTSQAGSGGATSTDVTTSTASPQSGQTGQGGQDGQGGQTGQGGHGGQDGQGGQGGQGGEGGWQPPIGIPAPSFGVLEEAGATTLVASASSPIPSDLPAGTVVEIQGVYDVAHTSPNDIRCAGTAEAPVFIRGAAGAELTGSWEISGSYCILEGLTFTGPGSAFVSPGDHLVLRDSEVRGTLDGGGFGLLEIEDTNLEDIVLLRLDVHDNGNLDAPDDQDIHGIGVYRSSSASGSISNVWLLDSTLARNSGDGIQINGNTLGHDQCHHIYVGRNESFGNKQSGFWTKQASDVIFSENLAHDHRPSNSSSGDCMGQQYDPERVWWLYNRGYACDNGLRVASDAEPVVGQNVLIIGNAFWDIHSDTQFQEDSGYSSAGIAIWGGVNRWVVHNTLFDVDHGIASPSGAGTFFIIDNIIASPRSRHHFFESASVDVLNDLTAEGANDTGVASCTDCVTGDPLFADADAGDFQLGAGSPAIDAGIEAPVYAAFEEVYGLSIRAGRPNGEWDIGAFER